MTEQISEIPIRSLEWFKERIEKRVYSHALDCFFTIRETQVLVIYNRQFDSDVLIYRYSDESEVNNE